MKFYNSLKTFLRPETRELENLHKRASKAFSDFANTDGGKDFLEYMYIQYCQYTAFSDNPERTYARLAEKELVENLIKNAYDVTMENNNE